MKHILVTGAGGGMGQAAVKMLRSHGFVVFALDINPIPEQDCVIPIVADVTDANSLQLAFELVQSVTPHLYGIVHFAGLYMLNSLIEISEKSFIQAFEINLFGAYRVNKIFAPLLRKGSRIIITTSELAPLEPLPFTGLYPITKSALDKYAASLRMELQLQGISVAVLRPGAVKTGMLAVSTDQLDSFSKTTRLYQYNAKRFRRVVDCVESKNISADAIAHRILRILNARRVRPIYSINRNPLLLLLNVLPVRLQLWIIRKILK